MKVLLSWLREFAPGISGSVAELSDALATLGLAPEEVFDVGVGLEGIVVARVLETRPHPKADRIQLVDVDAGDGEALQVCCGAFNMAAGDLVPLATVGSTMPDGRPIERRKMRGEWSNGMLCSAAELGFGDDHAGIMVLAGGAAPGQALTDALDLRPDVLFDLEVEGNRPDAMSVAGVARDLAAHQGVPFAIPSPDAAEGGGPDAATELAVEIVAPDLCGRFAARLLRDITVGPSPQWLANRLRAVGMRPINNVVDVSNYVMAELGQPSHTFDLAEIAGRALRVRWARAGEELVTLDGQTRSLDPRDGVIANGADEVISLAGVMGGASTEISERTSTVLLEMAWWAPMAIARTARRLGLRSEASTRFERGTDPEIVPVAMRRFAELLGSSGSLAPGMVDERGDLPPPARITVRTERVAGLLGVDIDRDTIRELLEPIGFRSEPAGGDDLEVTAPSFRPDATIEVDVVEEVARHLGYDNIPRRVPRSPLSGGLTLRQSDRRVLRHALVGHGMTEAMPMPFLAPGELERAGLPPEAVRVANPLVQEESVLRTSLRPGLLKTLAYNASHRLTGAQLFEIGHVFLPHDPSAELPYQPEYVGVALGGAEAPEAVAAWHVIADSLGFRDSRLVAAEPPGMHPTRSARIRMAGRDVGVLGEVDPGVLEAYGVGERVAWVEVNLDDLLALPHGELQYRRFSRFPSSDIDLAFVIADDVAAGDVAATLREAAGELLQELRLFDVYRGAQVGEGRRSVAFRLRLQALDRTLTDDEVADVRDAAIGAVEARHGAILR